MIILYNDSFYYFFFFLFTAKPAAPPTTIAAARMPTHTPIGVLSPVFTEVRPVVPPPSLLVDVEPPGTGVLVLSEGVTVGYPLGTGVFVTVGSGVVFLLLVISMEFS